tara:strand:+ start:54 stop:413 length:360 start_codon:yes stop_codon:yes gene_type:complete
MLKDLFRFFIPDFSAEESFKRRKSISEIQERYGMYPALTLEFFEIEAERLLEYVKVEGNEYKIIRVEELIQAISELKDLKFGAWERTGNPSYLGVHCEHKGNDGSKPGEKLPYDNLPIF